MILRSGSAPKILAAFLASIVQSSEDSIVGNGLDGIILSWNASSERFWGYAAEEVIGKHVKILLPPERAHEFERKISRRSTGTNPSSVLKQCG